MVYRFLKNTFLFLLFGLISCGRTTGQNDTPAVSNSTTQTSIKIEEPVTPAIVTGANRLNEYLPLLRERKVGLVGNQSSVIFLNDEHTKYVHIVDSLLAREVDLRKVYAPEHGFRGTADAGEVIKDGKDPRTGLPVISLYGDNKKPTAKQLEGIDVMIFDLQDVGTRFYTYISSLHYVMEACAENGIPLIILDRPNPNGHYIDGPILDPQFTTFVGMHPIPVVHGLTMGEYGKMINGEKWLKNGVQCELTVISMENYDHDMLYELAIKPSPNLPNARAVNLYPSLCFFEGTNVNAGRGTTNQFQVFGSPYLDSRHFDHSYTPQSMEGARSPKHLGKLCYGRDLTEEPRQDKINLTWLIEAYNHTEDKSAFFNNFFTSLAGSRKLQQQIEAGLSEKEIRETWETGLENFSKKREQYLLY
ncbi:MULTISPECIES: exo-beta-N-acetylmuramidase NamZ family protein [Antarcticibacterium]|nr:MULTISPECIES: DUF1343 domain-containing protein [Antarcticibacterium]